MEGNKLHLRLLTSDKQVVVIPEELIPIVPFFRTIIDDFPLLPEEEDITIPIPFPEEDVQTIITFYQQTKNGGRANIIATIQDEKDAFVATQRLMEMKRLLHDNVSSINAPTNVSVHYLYRNVDEKAMERWFSRYEMARYVDYQEYIDYLVKTLDYTNPFFYTLYYRGNYDFYYWVPLFLSGHIPWRNIPNRYRSNRDFIKQWVNKFSVTRRRMVNSLNSMNDYLKDFFLSIYTFGDGNLLTRLSILSSLGDRVINPTMLECIVTETIVTDGPYFHEFSFQYKDVEIFSGKCAPDLFIYKFRATGPTVTEQKYTCFVYLNELNRTALSEEIKKYTNDNDIIIMRDVNLLNNNGPLSNTLGMTKVTLEDLHNKDYISVIERKEVVGNNTITSGIFRYQKNGLEEVYDHTGFVSSFALYKDGGIYFRKDLPAIASNILIPDIPGASRENIGSDVSLFTFTGGNQIAIDNTKKKIALLFSYEIDREVLVALENFTEGFATKKEVNPSLNLFTIPLKKWKPIFTSYKDNQGTISFFTEGSDELRVSPDNTILYHDNQVVLNKETINGIRYTTDWIRALEEEGRSNKEIAILLGETMYSNAVYNRPRLTRAIFIDEGRQTLTLEERGVNIFLTETGEIIVEVDKKKLNLSEQIEKEIHMIISQMIKEKGEAKQRYVHMEQIRLNLLNLDRLY